MSMVSGKYNITCQRGSTFDLQLTLQYTNPEYANGCDGNEECPEFLVWDLTGYTARMHVRKYIESSTTLVELSTENPTNRRIILGNPEPTDGTITLFMRSEDTLAIASSGIYDLEIISPTNEIDRILQGNFILSLEVTR